MTLGRTWSDQGRSLGHDKHGTKYNEKANGCGFICELFFGFFVCIYLRGVSWQVQYFVDLEVQISWQVQDFVGLGVQISWQAQDFVDLEVQMSCQVEYFAGLEVQISWHLHYFVGLGVQSAWQAQDFVWDFFGSCFVACAALCGP